MPYALIRKSSQGAASGIVSQISDATFPVDVVHQWIEIVPPASPSEGDIYDLGTEQFTTPTVVVPSPLDGVTDLSQAKLIVHRLIASEFERRAAPIISGRWSLLERETFEQQLAEAIAFQADPGAVTPLLDQVVMEGETRSQAAANIVGNATALKAAVGPLLKRKREHLRALYQLTTVGAVAAYDITVGWS